jgi:hypothetical protein
MITLLDSRIGKQLYELLPSLYRTHDNNVIRDNILIQQGDLARFLDACGFLMDGIYDSLKQLLADTSIETCQPWLIAYHAHQLGVRLTMSAESKKRIEVARSIFWRQSKGTIRCVQDIAQNLMQTHFAIHEGWQRIITTARIAMPQTYYGQQETGTNQPNENSQNTLRHQRPMQMATADFRILPGKLTDLSFNNKKSASYVSNKQFSNVDYSKRTVDFRTPNWCNGHFHPKRLLFFVSSYGFFYPRQISIILVRNHINTLDEVYKESNRVISRRIFQTRNYLSFKINSNDFLALKPGTLDEIIYCVEDKDRKSFTPVLCISCQYQQNNNTLLFTMSGQTKESVLIKGCISQNMFPETALKPVFHFENICIENTMTLSSGMIEFEKVAAYKIVIHGNSQNEFIMHADNSLFKQIETTHTSIRLDYCTVLGQTVADTISAGNCLFNGEIIKSRGKGEQPDLTDIRYSRISLHQQLNKPATDAGCTQANPLFYTTIFGKSGCGVLHPATPDAIRFGADDGMELGAYHFWELSAINKKINDFLPMSMETVVVPDMQDVESTKRTTF